MFSIPEAKRKNGLSEEAYAGFLRIAENYPQEIKAYIQMMDIAIVDLRNPELAEDAYQRGLRALRKRTDREALTRMYEGIRTRITSAYDQPRERIKPR